MRAIAAILIATLVAPTLPSVVVAEDSVSMESIARVRKLRRVREQVRAARKPPANVRRDPGKLLPFVPKASPQLRAPDHLEPVASAVERSMTEVVEACVSVPPRHGKTTLIVHAIVWILIKNPRAQILYASYAHGFAAKQVRKAYRIAERAGVRFGDTRKRDEWNTAEGGFVKAAGIGGQITGEGFTHIFVDDPHKNRAEAESAIIREGVVEAFRDDIYTRQDPSGTSVFVIHTRWHRDDLIGVLTRPANDNDDEAAEPFEYINLQALRVAANDNGKIVVALAPKLFDVDRLLKLKARVGEYGWASLYMGSPRPRGGALFGGAVLVEEFGHHSAYRYSIGVDLARTARTRSDWNTAVVMRLDLRTDLIDVVEVVREQGVLADRIRDGESEPGFARRLHALQGRYPGAVTVMYTGRAEDQLLELLASLQLYPCRVEGRLAVSEKHERAQPYAAAWNEGRVRLERRAPWTNRFVAEHVDFTGLKGGLDDQVDAAAAAFDALASRRKVSLKEAMESIK